MTKEVYNPKEHATNDKKVGSKKAKAKEKPVTEFAIKKGLNIYGFIHVPKNSIPSLPFAAQEPLIARIAGKTLVIAAATEKQAEEARPSA